MTKEKKQIIRGRWDAIITNEKDKLRPFPDDILIEVGTFACVTINHGIELIAEAYGLEVERGTTSGGDIYKQLVIDGVHIHQWVKIGEWEVERNGI